MSGDDIQPNVQSSGLNGRRLAARLCSVLGFTGLAFVAIAYFDGAIRSHLAIAAFEQAIAQTPEVETEVETEADAPAEADEFNSAAPAPDQSQWSEKARAKYLKSASAGGVPLALLKIERLNLVAPVFPGTDAITLNRGAGIVEGTALPGEVGNIALSGHRDSFFRPLKDIAVGDSIELQSRKGVQHFRVSEIVIVDPLDVSVLEPADDTLLTLITCYPFYYVGYAPDRYIVRADLVREDATLRSSRMSQGAGS